MSIRTAFIYLTLISTVLTAIVVGVVLGTMSHVVLSASTIVGLLVALLAVLLVSVWLGYFFAQLIRRRLYEIEEAAGLLASGRLNHRITIMGTGDEIDQLGEQFNSMGRQLQSYVQKLQELAEENKQLASESERVAVLDERQRLARELHDSVSQQLFALTMLSAAAQRYFDSHSPELGNTLAKLNELSNAAQREMRALLLHLRPVELEGRSLHEAIEAFLEAVTDRHRLRTELTWDLNESVPVAIEQQLFRILQEAVSNVLKHAEASNLRVSVRGTADVIELAILDDGIGIETERPSPEGDSYGIRSMKERAMGLGGSFDVWRREQGTAVQVSIPRVVGQKGGRRQ
ncbi:histidine kinase [Alicyclobacillus sp. SO9]|uniref:sensor histidine kinase n=1 Tax=Alicyclobacillus sp. SO9 TaxID=2665646 RepID=UPI0018E83B51|nr:histidine kinase [Alicyclobacillus sp. SO9]QQE77659.1 HAMP domain-containing protein [Alicyclobacillus sp. SO9]